MSAPPPTTPRALFLAYALPYLVYAGLASVFDARSQPLLLYGARALLVGAALAWAWRSLLPLTGPRSALGSAALGSLAGLLGAGLWLALLWPFAAESAAPWSDPAWLARTAVATVLPALVEEPLLRGFALGTLLLWERERRAGATTPFANAVERRSLAEIAPGEWSGLALFGSSALFALGHAPAEWLAAFAYGLFLCGLWIARGDLVSCVFAHAVTNASLALYVRATGQWALW